MSWIFSMLHGHFELPQEWSKVPFPRRCGRANSCYSESSPQVFTIPRRDNVTNTFIYELINTSLVAGFSCFLGSTYVLTLLFWGNVDHFWDMFVWSGLKPLYWYSLFLYWQYWHCWWKNSRKPVGIDKAPQMILRKSYHQDYRAGPKTSYKWSEITPIRRVK